MASEHHVSEPKEHRVGTQRPAHRAWIGAAALQASLIFQVMAGWDRTGGYRIFTFGGLALLQLLLIVAVVRGWRRHDGSLL